MAEAQAEREKRDAEKKIEMENIRAERDLRIADEKAERE
jgi:hypothetical protein